MATAPQISLRDSSGHTTNLVYTTNEETVVLSGTVDVNTAAVQISVNGGPFVSDSNLVSFVLQTFSVPNLEVHPDGLPLDIGLNTIQLRTIDVAGGVSAISTATVTRVQSLVSDDLPIPSGIRVHRNRNTVDILAAKPVPSTDPQAPTFLGYNFYCSTTPAGSSGYFKLNAKPILTATLFEEDVLGESSPSDLALWTNTEHKFVRVRVIEEDEFGKELVVRLDTKHDASTLTGRLRYQGSLQNYTYTEFVKFTHDRAGGPRIINADLFSGVASSESLYYVVTGLYFDPVTGTEIETPYSQEVLGKPLVLDTTIRDLPGRNQAQIATAYVAAIQRVNQEISLIPGSTTRDITIDPFASEAERIWFLLDFVHRSQSFLTLLAIDDVNGDGISDEVATSAYKQALKAALGLTSDSAVQSLIDQQFDKLAANVNVFRSFGRPATGQVVAYTTVRPTKDIVVPATAIAIGTVSSGGVAPRFRLGGSYVLPAANADAFYNFDEKRYEIILDVVAEQIGSSGNVPAGSVKTLVGVSGLQVVNTEAIDGGGELESNAKLASKAILAYASVDTGTEGGYASIAANNIGVVKAKIVKSGDALMVRDYDEVRNKHIGGKVDIWVQGLRERTVTETFAFTFNVARNIQCQLIDLASLTLRVLDSRVTPNTPIVEILNDPSQNLGVRNVTTGERYDVAGVSIIDYQTFRLNVSLSQPVTHIDNIITVDYRFRVANNFVFSLQPVRRVVSVVGEVAGPLDSTHNFQLFKTDDPLIEGESTIAKNYLSVIQHNGKPSGNSVIVSDEAHVLIGSTLEPLNSVGVNTATIRVFSNDRLTEYNGPGSMTPDFDIVLGTATVPVKIVRTVNSQIQNGQTVSVDYIHDENFTVTYVINDVLQQLQQAANKNRHVTGDVLVKQAIQNDVVIETAVQLLRGASKDTSDPAIRSAVSREMNSKTIGQGVAQSNVDSAIDGSLGVKQNVLPMARMAYADGSGKLREALLPTYMRVPSLDIGGNIVYLLTNALQYPTTDGGGLATEHKGVFQGDLALTLAPTVALVGQGPDQAFIIGKNGAIIGGYSDDDTLTAAGFLPEECQAERVRRTANHVLISLSGAGDPVDTPSNHTYSVSYIIRGDSGAHDITVAAVEFLSLGKFTVTYHGES